MNVSGGTWAALLGFTVLAAVSQWLLAFERAQMVLPPVITSDRPDYSLDDFSLIVMDEQGQASFRVHAPRMLRRPSDGGAMRVESPVVDLKDTRDRSWQMRAASALIGVDGDDVLLDGGVELLGTRLPGADPAPNTEIRTTHMTLLPELRQAHTDAHVTLSEGASILSGTGMKADFALRRMELLSNVSARFEPPPR